MKPPKSAWVTVFGFINTVGGLLLCMGIVSILSKPAFPWILIPIWIAVASYFAFFSGLSMLVRVPSAIPTTWMAAGMWVVASAAGLGWIVFEPQSTELALIPFAIGSYWTICALIVCNRSNRWEFH